MGLALFALPFLQSGVGSRHEDGPHMDHRPHHGGSLLMLGNHHLEIVERGDTLEVHVSDAGRRPLRPSAATVRFDDGEKRPLAWTRDRLVVPKPAAYAWADYRIELEGDEPPLAIRLPAGGVSMPR